MPATRITGTLTRSPSAAETTVGTEVVLMTLESGQCFGLGETGSAVWRLLARPTRLEPLITALRAQYDAPPEVIETDVIELLEDMLERGLIEVGEQSPSPSASA